MPEQDERARKVSEVLLKYMKRCGGLRAVDIAKELRVSKTTVSNWIDGKFIPKHSHVISLANLFKLQGKERETFIQEMGYSTSGNDVADTLVTAKQVLFFPHLPQMTDEQEWINLIQEQLSEAGYTIKVGIQHLEESVNSTLPTIAVCLLSPATIHSETLQEEVDSVYQVAQTSGNLSLFALYVDLEETPLPQNLQNVLSIVNPIRWNSTMDKAGLLNLIQEKLNAPVTKPIRPYELEMVGGAIPLDSKFYVERSIDNELQLALQRRDSIVLIKGARQVGKTSLLARGLKKAREAGVVVLFTDFQRLVDDQLKSLETFFIAIGDMLAEQLGLDTYIEDKWRKNQTANVNFDRYFRTAILGRTEKNVLWAIDEADKILPHPFSNDVFAMFRTWHNCRATTPDTPCTRLTLAITYSTEPYLFIKNLHQSPFNVGTKITVEDFTLEQVADLNTRHGSPLTPTEVVDFYRWVGGHPYLVRCTLHEIVIRKLSFTQFSQRVEQENGVFGDHLRRIVMMIKRDPSLWEAMRSILRNQPCPDYDTFFRLHSAGIVVGSKDAVKLRCQVYERYLTKWLL